MITLAVINGPAFAASMIIGCFGVLVFLIFSDKEGIDNDE